MDGSQEPKVAIYLSHLIEIHGKHCVLGSLVDFHFLKPIGNERSPGKSCAQKARILSHPSCLCLHSHLIHRTSESKGEIGSSLNSQDASCFGKNENFSPYCYHQKQSQMVDKVSSKKGSSHENETQALQDLVHQAQPELLLPVLIS